MSCCYDLRVFCIYSTPKANEQRGVDTEGADAKEWTHTNTLSQKELQKNKPAR